MIRTGKTPIVLKLASGDPRDWNVPAVFWSCGQVKTFLVRGPSCFLCTLPQDPRVNFLSSKWTCEGSTLQGVLLRAVAGTLSTKESGVFRRDGCCCLLSSIGSCVL